MLTPESRVLVVSVARIGDTILMTPCLRALRRACGWLTVLAHPRRLDVLQHLQFIDELEGITKNTAPIKALFRRQQFDLAICFGRDLALVRYCMKAARLTVAFDCAAFRPLVSPALRLVPAPPESSMHAVRERMLLLEAAGVRTDDLRLSYEVTREERQGAEAWIRKNLPPGAGPLIGLQPFSYPTKAHRDWPRDQFIDLARRIVNDYPHAHIIVLGDEQARAHAGEFARALPGRCTVAAGTLSLRQSAALMQRLGLYVGVDTGPTHIAGALGIPMLAMYHASYIGRYLMPLQNPRSAAIEHPATFSDAAGGAEMAAITVDQAWAAAQGLLSGRRGEEVSHFVLARPILACDIR
ncbi:MAG TPA: glycosyltransferase family 9 protein [Burkholderiales bacterium]|nr:glycosyltransferase family 9 protein [Burkholderiales bacterium]